MLETKQWLLDNLETITADFKDSRVHAQRELRSAVWLLEYVFMQSVNNGVEIKSIILRQSWKGIQMTVKAVVEGTPQVVFITERTPMGCMVVFARQWFGERLKWVPDKYPVI